MTHKEENGNGDIVKRITAVTGMILGLSAVISLIVYLYGAQVFAAKTDMDCLERSVKDNYVTKELFLAKMETFDAKLSAVVVAVGARVREPR
jgi:tetrahydromethanopterin S-methyltransferase subunit D